MAKSFPPFSSVQKFVEEDQGSATILALFLVLISATVGGLAIDYSKAMARRTHLQVTSDAVAHAALYTRERKSREEAINKALQVAAVNLPSSKNGNALLHSDIEFGVWDAQQRVFTPDPGSKNAVRVSAHRVLERDNAVTNILLRMVGYKTFDLSRSAVYVTYQPTCFREGFVAEKRIDVQSNNSFQNGFCIHSNDHVKVSSNNEFGENTIVSMPNSDNLQLPRSGFDTNKGLEDALRDNGYHLRVLTQLDQLITDLRNNSYETRPDYISTSSVKVLDGKNIDGSEFKSGEAYYVTCDSGARLRIKGDTLISNTTIATNCAINFGQGVTLEDTVMATTHTGAKSIDAPSSLQIGRNDNCAPGGGAQLLTMGGVDLASDMRMYGGQILAKGDVSFAANANGIEGGSIISGGEISGTSNMTMGFCGDGMEDNFRAEYFRLVQ